MLFAYDLIGKKCFKWKYVSFHYCTFMILFCSVVLQGQSFKPSEPLWESMGMEILSEHWVINPP